MPGKHIDTVYVDVLPDVSNFAAKTERDLNKALSGAEKAADNAAKEMEGSFEESFAKIDKDAEKALRSIDAELASFISRQEKHFEDLDKAVEKSFSDIEKKAKSEIPAIDVPLTVSKKSFEGFFQDVNGRWRDAKGKFVPIGTRVGEDIVAGAGAEVAKNGAGAVSGGLKNAFSELSGPLFALGIALGTELVAAAGPAVAALGAALPGAIGVAGAGIGTLILGLHGLDDAFKDMGDAEKFNEDLKKLSPSTRAFAIEVKNLMPQLRAIQQAAAEGIFKGLQGELTAVVKALQGPLKTGLFSVGQSFNDLARGFTGFLMSADGIKTVNAIFATTHDVIEALAPALNPFLTGIGSLVQKAQPFITLLATKFAGALDSLGGKLSKMAADGTLDKLFDKGLETLGKFIHLAEGLTELLFKLFVAAQPGGESFLDTLIKITDQFNELLSSKEGMAALTEIFSALEFILTLNFKALTLAKDAGVAFHKALVKVKEVVTDVGHAIKDAWSKAGDWIDGAKTKVGQFIDGVEGWFKDLPTKIGDFLSSLPGKIEDAFSTAFDAAVEAVGIGIGLILASILELPGRGIDALNQFGIDVRNFFTNLWTTVSTDVEVWFTGTFIPWLMGLPQRFLGAIFALKTLVTQFFADTLAAVQEKAVSGFNAVIDFVKSVPSRIVALAAQFLAAGRNLIGSLISGLSNGGAAGSVASAIVGKIKDFLNGVIGSLNHGINDVGSRLHVSLPNIPMLAGGGVTTGPIVAGLGEAGQEVVLPLAGQRGRQTFEMIAQAAAGNSPSIIFNSGSVAVSFEGTVPTEQQAFMTGQAVGRGITAVLERRDVRIQVRRS